MFSLKSKRTFFIAASLFVLAGVGIFIFLKFFIFDKDTASVLDFLDKADNFIDSGYYQEAERVLIRAFDTAGSDDIMLRIIKRFHTLGKKTENFERYYSFSKKAAERYPGNKVLMQNSLYALLRQGRFQELLEAYPDTLESPRIQAILAEALLRNGETTRNEKTEKSLPGYAGYFSDNGTFTTKNLIAAYDAFGDRRYMLDAALLYMKAGHIETAYMLALKKLNTYEFDEPAGLIAYDYGKWDEARVRLSRFTMGGEKRPEIELILGDIDIALEKYDQAKERFENAIEYDDAVSPNAYINLATILQRQGFKEKAEYLLKTVVGKYPESIIAGTEYAKFLFFKGEKDRAIEMVKNMQGQYPDNEDLQFLLLAFSIAQSSSRELWIEDLNSYFQEYPSNEQAAEILVYTFLKYRHLVDSQRVIALWSEASGKSDAPWSFEAQGIITALDGNLDKAAGLLQKAVRRQERWDFHYNYAVVLFETGNLEAAITEANAAAFVISSGASPGKHNIARVLVLQGRIRFRQKKTDEAAALAKKALEYDNTSTEAWELTKMLEAGK